MTHLEKMLQPDSPYVFYDDQHGFCINTDDVLMLFEPERKKGEWVCEIDKYYSENVYCSICKTRAPYIYVCNDPYGRDAHGERKKTNFCPNCGADMRGENIC